MALTIFDTQTAVAALRSSGLDEGPAIAIVNTLRDGLAASFNEVAAKADLAVVRADLATLKADLYRALWIQGAGLVTVQIAIAGFVVALVKLL